MDKVPNLAVTSRLPRASLLTITARLGRMGWFILVSVFCLGLKLSASGQTLGDALEATSVTWTTSSNANWRSQTVVTHDGQDAAQSGAINNNQTSSIQATFTGPGAIRYWRKVSSEEFLDYFRVYVDGTEVPDSAISGETEWEQHIISLKAGSHVVKWSYIKDEDLKDGSDAAWLDQMTFLPADQGAPFIAEQPKKCGVEAGATLSLPITVLGHATLQYQWRRNGSNLAGQNSATLTIPSFSSANAGNYDCVITNTSGTVTSISVPVSLVSLGQAVDDTSRYWVAKGNAYWTSQTQITWDGVDALKGGPIGADQSSQFESTFTGPGTLTFRARVSTEEDYDFLRVRVDGATVYEISGIEDWNLVTVAIPSGSHVVNWSYEKNALFVFGADTVWIDHISFQSNYSGWRTAYFTTADLSDSTVSGALADPNHNGISNAWEYALGENPKSCWSCGADVVSINERTACSPNPFDGYMTLRLLLPAALPDDVTLEVQQAASPQADSGWTTLARKTGNAAWVPTYTGSVIENVLPGGKVEVLVRQPDTFDLTPTQRFMRATVTVPGS